MRQLLFLFKTLLQKLANRSGYHIERRVETGGATLDVFDLVVQRLVSEVPDFFFVQIGANDGITDDPMRRYIQSYHWRGLLVEPQPRLFTQLKANYDGEPQLLFENAAVARQDGEATLYVVREGEATCLASFDKRVIQKGLGYRIPIDEIVIPALSLNTLLRKHQISHVDLLQIDTEGFDFEIIQMIDFVHLKPRVIQFEHLHLSNADRNRCFALLASQGYRLHRDGINTLAVLPWPGS